MRPVGRLAGRDDEQARQAMTAAARAALRGGVTTVRDLGDRGYLALGLRGTAGLPTILAAGPPLTTPGGHCHYLGGAVEPTAAAAGVLGLGSRKGRVAPGFDADLLSPTATRSPTRTRCTGSARSTPAAARTRLTPGYPAPQRPGRRPPDAVFVTSEKTRVLCKLISR